MRIFISIAAYREPELGPTLADCLAKAAHAENLAFGICWQHGAEEKPPEEFSLCRLRLIGLDWRESKGACWARAEVMKGWDGEDWFLQIGSHRRFAQDWDALLLAEARATGVAKPLLTAGAAAYEPPAPPPPGHPTRITFERFDDDGVLYQGAAYLDETQRSTPMRARFLSAHFLFPPGSFVSGVPNDPEFYFHGEEISLALRAFTHGYDLFHPSRHILWRH